MLFYLVLHSHVVFFNVDTISKRHCHTEMSRNHYMVMPSSDFQLNKHNCCSFRRHDGLWEVINAFKVDRALAYGSIQCQRFRQYNNLGGQFIMIIILYIDNNCINMIITLYFRFFYFRFLFVCLLFYFVLYFGMHPCGLLGLVTVTGGLVGFGLMVVTWTKSITKNHN